MINSQKRWLSATPWEAVLTLNSSLCQANQLEPLIRAGNVERARTLWLQNISLNLTLLAALDICHESCELAPFTFNNANTFAAIGRGLVEKSLEQMPALHAQIVRTTVGHYIAGKVGRRELKSVLTHFASAFGASLAAPVPSPATSAAKVLPPTPAEDAAAPEPAPQPEPEAQPQPISSEPSQSLPALSSNAAQQRATA